MPKRTQPRYMASCAATDRARVARERDLGLVFFADPPAGFDEIALHIAAERDGASKPESAEAEKVQEKFG